LGSPGPGLPLDVLLIGRLDLASAALLKAPTVIPAPSLIATLSDALRFVDAIDDIEAELVGAEEVVKRSREFTLSAAASLTEERQRFQFEKDLCSKLVRDCERRLRRQYLARACIETALVPVHVLVDLVWCTPRRAFLRRKLQRRIQTLGICSRGLAGLQARIDSLSLPFPLASPKARAGFVLKTSAFPRRSQSSRLRRASSNLSSAEEPRFRRPAPVLRRA
jgi:hypothetical protein